MMKKSKLENKVEFLLGCYGKNMYYGKYYKAIGNTRQSGKAYALAGEQAVQIRAYCDVLEMSRHDIDVMFAKVLEPNIKKAVARAENDLPRIMEQKEAKKALKQMKSDYVLVKGFATVR